MLGSFKAATLAVGCAVVLGGCAYNYGPNEYRGYEVRGEQSVRFGVVESVRPVRIQPRGHGSSAPSRARRIGGIAGSTVGGGTGQIVGAHRRAPSWAASSARTSSSQANEVHGHRGHRAARLGQVHRGGAAERRSLPPGRPRAHRSPDTTAPESRINPRAGRAAARPALDAHGSAPPGGPRDPALRVSAGTPAAPPRPGGLVVGQAARDRGHRHARRGRTAGRSGGRRR